MTRWELSGEDGGTAVRTRPRQVPDREAVPDAGRRSRRVPGIVRRRLAPLENRLDPWSWVVAAVVAGIAAIVRLIHLDRPGHIIFDETYYAPNAYALLRYGVEWQVQEGGANPVGGSPVWGDGAAYVVHPPLGKWLIGAGEWLFGYDPYGWRIAAAVAGIASVLMIVRIGRRLFGSTVLGAAAGLLMAFDGMHLVMSRVALLDIFLLFFLVAGFGALLLDRDSRRRAWLVAVAQGRTRPASGWRTGVPWWRWTAAALLGAALAVKWSAAFFIPVFLVLVIVWEVGARRSAGVSRPWRSTATEETPGLLVSAVIVPLVYLASWAGWFATNDGYFRHWRADTGQSEPPVLGALLNLLHYHQQALSFHLPLASDHPYASSAWQWLLLAKPVAFHWSTEGECGAESCASAVLLVGTPLLWWSFLPALAALVWFGIARRDWRVPPILLGAVAGIGPWFIFDERVSFYFYALPAQPFLVLAVVYVLGALISPARAGRPALSPGGTLPGGTLPGGTLPGGALPGGALPGGALPGRTWLGLDRRTVAVVLAGAYVLLVALNFAYFYPIYTGETIPYEAWYARIWVSSWI